MHKFLPIFACFCLLINLAAAAAAENSRTTTENDEDEAEQEEHEERELVKREQKQQQEKDSRDTRESRRDVAFCEGTTSAFFVSENVLVREANATATIAGLTDQQCLALCRDNRDTRGRTVLCGSAVYEQASGQCRLYRRASGPDGELRRASAEGHKYFEKFCLADDLPMECAHRQFLRVDDHILKGYAQSTTTVPTMAECIAYCVREREFECKSAMYFYEEGECITNVESASTAPEDFQRPEDEDRVVFVQNGCLAGRAEALVQEEQPTTVASTSPSSTTTTTASEATSSATSIPPEIPSSSITPPPPPTILPRENPGEFKQQSREDEEEQGQKLEENGQLAAEARREEEEQQQRQEAPVGFGAARLHPKQFESTRQYGARTIERTTGGQFQEKVETSTTAENGTISTGAIRLLPGLAHKSPDSKRLQLKLIKDQQQQQQQRPPPPNPPPSPVATVDQPAPAATTAAAPPAIVMPAIDAVAASEQSPDGALSTDGYFSPWGPWTICSVPGERRVRKRRCLDLRRCKGSLMQVDYCPRDIPAVEEEAEEGPGRSAAVAEAPLLVPQQPIQVPQLQPQPPPQEQQIPKRSPEPIDLAIGTAQPPAIQPPQKTQTEVLPAGAPAPRPVLEQDPQQQQHNSNNDAIWSPWTGSCQHFASSQPCKDGQVIGFEARECVAKDPLACRGPFFRYCTLPC